MLPIAIQLLAATALLGLNALLVYWLYRVRADYRDELACRELVARLAERDAVIRDQGERLRGLEAAFERLSLRVAAFGGRGDLD